MTKQQKNIALIIAFVLAIILCYTLAIQNTFQLRKQYHALTHNAALFQSTPEQLARLKQKEVYYDSLLVQFKIDGSSIQNNLLTMINTYASSNALKVVSFLEPHRSITNDLVVKTYDFTLEGNYNTINQLIYILEQKTKFGEIIGLYFEKKKNYRTGRFYLQARVLLKSFGA